MQKTPPAVDIANWVIHIKQELAGCECNALMHEKPCIKRVPAPLHLVKPSAFTPQTVAIGPFHRNLVKEGLYAYSFAEMEEYKLEAAKILSAAAAAAAAQSSCVEGASFFETLVQEITVAEKEVRACFGKEMGLEALGTEALGCMLALDCIFIVAFLQSFYQAQLHKGDADADDDDEDDDGCRVPSSFWRVYEAIPDPLKEAVLLDLLLLENQMPLFLVKKVMQMMHGIRYGEDVEARLQAMVHAIANKTLPFYKWPVKSVEVCRDAKHLLDYLYIIVTHNMDDLVGPSNSDKSTDPLLTKLSHVPTTTQLIHVPTATELHGAGVKFEGHSSNLSHVSFKGHILTLPIIHVGDEMQRIFRNLLAHESWLDAKHIEVASYLNFMNSLINTADDVALLVAAGILTEDIGDYNHVANIWNTLARNTVMCIVTCQYGDVASRLKTYMDVKTHRLTAEIRERYFSRPWLVLSLLSGIALLVMNFLIMWYTIKVYIKA